jgi:uncharacterized protein YqgC (DUF456 family)
MTVADGLTVLELAGVPATGDPVGGVPAAGIPGAGIPAALVPESVAPAVSLFGFEALGLLAVTLLVVGVVGSALPAIPGASLSVAGLLLFWWHTGFTRPGPVVLGLLGTLGLIAVAADWFAGPIAAKAGGASTRTTVLAGAVGFLLLFVAGPLGIVVGIAGTVFLLQFRATGDPGRSARTAGFVTVGVLASVVVQVLVTSVILVGFLVAV